MRYCYCLSLIMVTTSALPAAGQLHCRQPKVDVGLVYSGARLTHTFPLTNNGTTTIEIDSPKVSCGCLAPRLSTKSLQPGEACDLELEVRTLTPAQGPHTWRVNIPYRSGAETAVLALELAGRIVTEVSVQPAALVLFADRAANHGITLTDSRAVPLKVTGVRSSSVALETHLGASTRTPEGQRAWRIDLKCGNEYPDGRHEETVVISTSDPRYPELAVPVTVIKKLHQRVTPTPGQVELLTAPGQRSASRLVLLRDSSDQPVKVEEAVVDDDIIQCKWADGPRSMTTLRIQVDLVRLGKRPLASAVHVKLRGPVQATLTIPVRVETR